MAEWKAVDISIFPACTRNLSMDELLFTEKMDTLNIMSALDVNSPRIDSHLFAGKLFDFDDVVASGISIPNEDISAQQIREIEGKLFDLQFARFDGHCVYQTCLISIYTNPRMVIKSDLLKHVVYAFEHCWVATEEYAMRTLSAPNTYWSINKDYRDWMHKLPDAKETREFLLNFKNENKEVDDIIDTALFELDFAEYITEFPKKEIPPIPSNIVAVSSEIGLFPTLHYRKLPMHSPPVKVEIFDHQTTIAKFKEFYEMLKEIQNYPKTSTIESIIDNIFRWGYTHTSALSFARIMLGGLIVQPEGRTLFHDLKIADFLQNDLSRFRVPDTMFKNQDYKTISKSAFNFLSSLIHTLMAPLAYAHGYLTKFMFQMWSEIEKALLSLEQFVGKGWHYPITGYKEYDHIIRTAVMLWCAPIGAKLTQYYIVLGFATNTYQKDDHAIAAMILKSSMTTVIFINERQCICNAVYQAVQHKKSSKKRLVVLKPSDVQKEIRHTAEQSDARALMAFFDGCFHLSRWCYKTGAIPPHKGIFFDAGFTYWERAMHPNLLFSIEMTERTQYMEEFDYSKVTPQEIANKVRAKFDESKKYILEAISLDQKTEERTSFLRNIIIATAVLLQWKEGMKICVAYPEPRQMVFTLIK